MQTPLDGRRVPTEAGAEPEFRVVTLVAGQDSGLGLLAGVDGLTVKTVAVPAEVGRLAREVRADIVVLAPNHTDAWPVSVAEGVAADLAGSVPLLVVFEAPHDGEVLEQRIGGPGVTLIMRAAITTEQLVHAIRDAVARYRTRSSDLP